MKAGGLRAKVWKTEKQKRPTNVGPLGSQNELELNFPLLHASYHTEIETKAARRASVLNGIGSCAGSSSAASPAAPATTGASQVLGVPLPPRSASPITGPGVPQQTTWVKGSTAGGPALPTAGPARGRGSSSPAGAASRSRSSSPAHSIPLCEAVAMLDEFERLCANPDGVRESILCGEQATSFLRGVRWRVFLGTLSQDNKSWVKEVAKHRDQYTQWRNQYIVNPRAPSPGSERSRSSPAGGVPSPSPDSPTLPAHCLSASAENPLSQNEASPWNLYFRTIKLQREINEDVIRTYSDMDFFTGGQPGIPEMLNRILFIYAMLNPTLGYIQGMNELLAPLVYVVHSDAQKLSDAQDSYPQLFSSTPLSGDNNTSAEDADMRAKLKEVSKLEFVEHDTFFLFNSLMSVVSELFTCSPNNKGEHAIAFVKCDRVQEILTLKDYETSVSLLELDIQPQLYMLRWVRIMFSQVFGLLDVVQLWDAIFAVGPPFRLVDHLCVAMITLIRSQILGQEYSSILHLLFHYPRTIATPRHLIYMALASMRSPVTQFYPAQAGIPPRPSPLLGSLSPPPSVRSPPPPKPDRISLLPFTSPEPSTPIRQTRLSMPPVMAVGATPTGPAHANSVGPQMSTPQTERPKSMFHPADSWSAAKPNRSRSPGPPTVVVVRKSPTPGLGNNTVNGASGTSSPQEREMETLSIRGISEMAPPDPDGATALKLEQAHLSLRLERVIFSLQRELGGTANAALGTAITELEDIKAALRRLENNKSE